MGGRTEPVITIRVWDSPEGFDAVAYARWQEQLRSADTAQVLQAVELFQSLPDAEQTEYLRRIGSRLGTLESMARAGAGLTVRESGVEHWFFRHREEECPGEGCPLHE